MSGGLGASATVAVLECLNKQVFKALATYDVNRHQYPADAKRQGGSAFGNVNARF
ncbi:hypothetical protein X797_008878 [Metarhizium robertsii]|uniref:Uncharacterized protein n=1 Tax=Metarhizium robertsii TaxID=568076 RepID=A0A014N022_9HYPO|nr:hypothetical protein X797_008878 [Metarhizium robertsii]